MKLLIIVAAVIAACASSAIPLNEIETVEETPVEPSFEANIDYEAIPSIPGDNSHYVQGKSRYIWMADDKGVPRLIDLHMPANASTTDSRNAGSSNEYWLYTRLNPHTPQRLSTLSLTVWASNYLASRPLRVIVHGFMSKGSSDVNSYITSAFLSFQDVNVIVVDWSAIANHYNYNKVAEQVPEVGQALGDFLDWLIRNHGGNWNNVHLVGHSLGAHVVGNAGRPANGRAIRVTGLDPAGPGFETGSAALSRTSGTYVEAIHTDGGLLGIFNPVADADFYPNGGKNPQPGCRLSLCSHSRAWELFASSIENNRFRGRQCVNLNEAENIRCNGIALNMGNGNRSKSGSGLYGLVTGSSWPF